MPDMNYDNMIGIYEIDITTQTFVNVSHVVCSGLGYTKEELVGKPISMVLTPESVEHFRQRMEKMNRGEVLDGQAEYIVVTKDGRKVPVEIEAFYKIKDGGIVGAIVAVREAKKGEKADDT